MSIELTIALPRLAAMESFGSRLKHLREQMDLSQRDLAKAIDASGPTIALWETGQTNPDRITRSLLEATAHRLNTTSEYLLKGTGAHVRMRKVGEFKLPVWTYAQAVVFVYSSPHRTKEFGEEQQFVLSDRQYSPSAFALEVSDDSMAPEYPRGMVAIVDPETKPYPNAVVAIGYSQGDGDYVTLRFYHDRGLGSDQTHRFEAVPAHGAYRTLDSSDPSVRVLGVMVERRFYTAVPVQPTAVARPA